jgi:hypothetical protein
MSLNLALKNAFTADLEKSIETHKAIPIGNFKSDYESQKAFGIIQGFESAKKHYETLYANLETINNTQDPRGDDISLPVMDAEIVDPQ